MTSLRSRIVHRSLHQITGALVLSRSIQEQRMRMDEIARRGIRLPRGVSIRSTQAGSVHAEWIEPQGYSSQRVILYLHGGGYCICSLDTHRGLASRLALACRARLLNVEYRLAPENPYPAALEDSLEAFDWLRAQGISTTNIILGGDSAGGGLALATCTSLRDAGKPLPGALFLISPWTDLTFSGDSVRTRKDRDPIFGRAGNRLEFAPAYLGIHDPKDPHISPLFADLQGLPPSLIQVGDDEILLDDSTRLAQKLARSGVESELIVWDGMWHVFPVFAPYVPEAQRSIDKIGDFIRSALPDTVTSRPN